MCQDNKLRGECLYASSIPYDALRLWGIFIPLKLRSFMFACLQCIPSTKAYPALGLK